MPFIVIFIKFKRKESRLLFGNQHMKKKIIKIMLAVLFLWS